MGYGTQFIIKAYWPLVCLVFFGFFFVITITMENLIFLQNNQTGDRGALMYIRYIKTILLNFCGFFEITFELSFELIVAEVFKYQ